MNQRETVSPELAEQNANLDVIRRLYDSEIQELRRRMSAIERTVKVRSLAHNTAREVELREKYGRLGMPR